MKKCYSGALIAVVLLFISVSPLCAQTRPPDDTVVTPVLNRWVLLDDDGNVEVYADSRRTRRVASERYETWIRFNYRATQLDGSRGLIARSRRIELRRLSTTVTVR
jgi:hypothetical protein